MKLAVVTFHEGEIFTPESIFKHLKGWWIPPEYVTEFWSCGAKFQFESEEDYIRKKKEILESRENSIKTFWREMVY